MNQGVGEDVLRRGLEMAVSLTVQGQETGCEVQSRKKLVEGKGQDEGSRSVLCMFRTQEGPQKGFKKECGVI